MAVFKPSFVVGCLLFSAAMAWSPSNRAPDQHHKAEAMVVSLKRAKNVVLPLLKKLTGGSPQPAVGEHGQSVVPLHLQQGPSTQRHQQQGYQVQPGSQNHPSPGSQPLRNGVSRYPAPNHPPPPPPNDQTALSPFQQLLDGTKSSVEGDPIYAEITHPALSRGAKEGEDESTVGGNSEHMHHQLEPPTVPGGTGEGENVNPVGGGLIHSEHLYHQLEPPIQPIEELEMHGENRNPVGGDPSVSEDTTQQHRSASTLRHGIMENSKIGGPPAAGPKLSGNEEWTRRLPPTTAPKPRKRKLTEDTTQRHRSASRPPH